MFASIHNQSLLLTMNTFMGKNIGFTSPTPKVRPKTAISKSKLKRDQYLRHSHMGAPRPR